ncbi:MAG: NTP/NDP exchange transporter [Alphaproteobacteria bacterium]|nr:MAG: NTP/NDP exchange transporter [Alphaproteobacteria bacterium]
MSTKPSDNTPEFGKLRSVLWPIHGHELKKFLPMGLILFCLLFNYTILRDLKDSIIVNASGAGTIPFLKLWGVTPTAILFVILYAKLSNAMTREGVFYTLVTAFLVYFGAYGFFIHPNAHALQASAETLEGWHAAYPFLSGLIDVAGNWGYSSFYIMAEIWGSSMVALLFWQFANQTTRIREAKRFYGLFVVLGNVALMISGELLVQSNNPQLIASLFPEINDPFEVIVKFFMGAVVFFGLVSMYLYRWMHTSVLTDPQFFDATEVTVKKKKEKPTLAESAKIIFSSPELGLIALLIMAYGITINLAEVQWKDQIRLFVSNEVDPKAAYAAFMGRFSFINGLITILFGWFIGSAILRRFSWRTAASITPLFMLLGGALFFAFILLKSDMGAFLSTILNEGATRNAIVAATALGFAVIVMAKSIKYTLFDPTKEMAYIPLNAELQSKGKAAVDVIGGRAGKSGGAFVQSTLLMLYGTKEAFTIAPIACGVFITIALLWLVAVKALSKKVEEAGAKTTKA